MSLAYREDICNFWCLDEGRKIAARSWPILDLVVISPSRNSVDLSDVTFVGGAFMLRLLCDKGGDRWPKALALLVLVHCLLREIFTNRGSAEGRRSCSNDTVGVFCVDNSKGNEQKH